jgi:predicted enzyme related to lactoylglutathione lyase
VAIICIERVIVAVPDLDAACERWGRAGFGIAQNRFHDDGIAIARLYAGAVEIDLCADEKDSPRKIPEMLNGAIERGGGVVGWTWGIDDAVASSEDHNSLKLPTHSDSAQMTSFGHFLPGVWAGAIATDPDSNKRPEALARLCGENQNTVDYLEHIVVMTPSLEEAIAAHEKIGLPCKRIREAGGGMRQAFFKLEQTVLEIVGPARGASQVWGLAFMCKDIKRAVEVARANGMEATEPKAAIQGGRIARIVSPLDGVAIAYMEPA